MENGVILDARYQVLGCPGAIASAMAVVDLIKGKKIADARNLNDGDVFRLLEDIPVPKEPLHRAGRKNAPEGTGRVHPTIQAMR